MTSPSSSYTPVEVSHYCTQNKKVISDKFVFSFVPMWILVYHILKILQGHPIAEYFHCQIECNGILLALITELLGVFKRRLKIHLFQTYLD